MTASERDHEKVFGDSFHQYSKQDMKPLIENLEIRFEVNGHEPSAVFSGACCLDAGCGGGPASLFMARYGASSVESIDISESNVLATQKNAERFGFGNIHAQQGTIEKIPFEDESFDVVWSYGVVHHTEFPDACLSELARVLKVGGTLILFMYGSGGTLWYTVYRSRQFTQDIDIDLCRNVLELADTEINMLISIMDNWKVPYLRVYTHDQIGTRLGELGFEKCRPLELGMHWDTNHRRAVFDGDAIWMGSGDLRYIVRKSSKGLSSPTEKLHVHNLQPDDKYDDKVISTFGPYFEEIDALSSKDRTSGLLAYRKIFIKVAELLRSKEAFDWRDFENCLAKAVTNLKAIIR